MPPSPPPTPPTTPPTHTLSDIFSDSPPSSLPHTSNPSLQTQIPSDIPRLRTTHTTAGYRDGVSSSKTLALQPGFDEGYPLGAVLGLRVGWVLGVLEGLCGALRLPTERSSAAGSEEGWERLQRLLGEAREALKMEKVFGREWWGEDGVWTYAIGEKEQEGEVTFEEVADKHPLVREWVGRVKEEMRRLGVEEGRFEGKEWEEGRG